MSITRATSKALRIPLGWIMTLAGYSGTPFEEMTEDMGRQVKGTTTKPKPAPAQVPGKKKPAAAKKLVKPSTPKGVDPDNVQDAEVETHDMTLHDKVDINSLKGVNKEFDKWLRLAEDVGASKKEVLVQCQDMLGKDMEMDEFREIKKKLGMDVK